MKFGITEAGDASFDYSWKDKLNSVDMAILITKNITDKFIEEILKVKNKVILHATCTGYGGTIVEPNVPNYKLQLEKVRKLIRSGFPKEQIVVRIDPVIPTKKGCEKIKNIVEYINEDVKRFRISVIDNYKHVQERFENAGLPILFNGNFQAYDKDFELVDDTIKELKEKHSVVFESCAENKLFETEKIGCVSKKDLSVFGLQTTENMIKNNRANCLCLAGKTELLRHIPYGFCNKFKIPDMPNASCGTKKCKDCKEHTFYGCPNACLYCYWKS